MKKFLEYFKIGIKAFAKFLSYVYACQISYLFLAVLILLICGKFWGILAIAWGIILLIAEIKQQKAAKAKETTPVL
jgi:hypothetical protein